MAEQTPDPLFDETPAAPAAPAPKAAKAAKVAAAPETPAAPAPPAEEPPAPELTPVEAARASYAASQERLQAAEAEAEAARKEHAEASVALTQLEAGTQPSLHECNQHAMRMNAESDAQRAETLAALQKLGLVKTAHKPHPPVFAMPKAE